MKAKDANLKRGDLIVFKNRMVNDGNGYRMNVMCTVLEENINEGFIVGSGDNNLFRTAGEFEDEIEIIERAITLPEFEHDATVNRNRMEQKQAFVKTVWQMVGVLLLICFAAVITLAIYDIHEDSVEEAYREGMNKGYELCK